MNRSDDGSLVSGKIEGLVVASDFGYSGDFGDNLVFAINDIPSQRTLVYRDEDTANLKASPLAKKDLVSKRIYSFNRGQETYPFKSLNPLKSDYYTWSLVNFSTDEVYKALKEIGFDW